MDPSIKTEIEYFTADDYRECDGWRKENGLYDPTQLNKNVLIFRCMIHSC